MKKIADPEVKAQRRKDDLARKRKNKRVAEEQKAAKKEARERESEILSELRLADELVKKKHASNKSGRHKRKLIRRKNRVPDQVQAKKAELPIVTQEEHYELGILTTSKQDRRKNTGKNKAVVNRTYPKDGVIKKKTVAGMTEYHVKKAQPILGKEHKPHEVPKRVPIIRHGVAHLLHRFAEQNGMKTRNISLSYVGKKGAIKHEIVKIPVEVKRKPTSIPIDRSPTVEPRRPSPKSGVVMKAVSPKQPKNGNKTLVVFDPEMCVTRTDQREWKLGKKDRTKALQADNVERRNKRLECEAKQPGKKKSKVKPRIAKKLAKLAARQGQAAVTRVKVQKVDTKVGSLIIGEYRTKSGRKITVQSKGTHAATVSSAA